MSGPTGRVLTLLSLLQTHRFWSGTELADRLEVSDRTLRRDVDRLRDLGYEVDATTGSGGGYRLAAGAHLPPLLLDDEEAVAVAVGLVTVAGAAIEGIEDTSVRALAKLRQVLPDHLRRQVEAIGSNVTLGRRPGPVTTAQPGDLALLAQACRDHEDVRFDYRRRDGEESRRLVHPHHLVASGRTWYLIAWDVRRDDWRTFRVDRLSDSRLGGVRFVPRNLPAPDPATFVERSIESMSTTYRVAIEVEGPLAEVADATCWIDSRPQVLAPDRTRIVVRADDVDWLNSLIAMVAASFPVALVEDPPEEIANALAALHDRLGGLVHA